MLVSLAVLVLAAPGVGKHVTLDFKQAPAREVVAVLADVSKRNLIVVDGADTKLDLQVKDTPWDTALEQVVKTLALETLTQGNVELIGTRESLARYEKKTFTAKRVTLRAVEADPGAVAEALAEVTGTPFALSGGTSRLTLNARNVPADQLIALAKLLTGARERARTAWPRDEGCAAAKLPMEVLMVTAVVSGTANPLGVIEDDTGTSAFLERRGCVSDKKWTVKSVLGDSVALASGDVLQVGKLYEEDLVRIPMEQALREAAQVDETVRPWTLLLLSIARDVLKLDHVTWSKTSGALHPTDLAERVEASLLDLKSTPEAVKAWVPVVKKKTSLMPLISTWVLSTSGDHAAALAVLETWVKDLGPKLQGEEPGVVAARRTLAWERAHGGDAAALDRLSAQLDAATKGE